MKKLFLISTLICTPAVMAHNNPASTLSFNTEQCEIELRNDIKISVDEIEIFTNNNNTMQYTQNGTLRINGEEISLTEAQHSTLNQYTENLREHLPEVASIALAGIDIAEMAISEVANALNIKGLEDVSELMQGIHSEVENTFYQQGTFVMGQQSFNQFSDNFEQHFAGKIDQVVESALMQSMGSVLVALGSELMGTDGNIQTFEQRMEKMGQQVEEKVERQAQQLKRRADTLCNSFNQIAQQEQLLVLQVPELEGYQLFEISKKHSAQE